MGRAGSSSWLSRRGISTTRPESSGYTQLPLVDASSRRNSLLPKQGQGNETCPPHEDRRWIWCFRLLVIFVPSFLARRGEPRSHERKLSRSSWLDGLRGVAAFVVVWHHSSLLYFSWDMHNAWVGHSSWLIQLPILRLVVSGIPAVCIFFVISGYAISLKLLRLAHQRKTAAFADVLSSSLFRRLPRLFMPAAGVLLLTAFLSYIGVFPRESWSDHVAIGSRVPPQGGTMAEQLILWGEQCFAMANPLRDTVNSRDDSPWDPNLWTLPVEFGCSMLVFVLLAIMHKFGPFTRMAFTASLIVFCLARAEQNVFLFLSGVLLADIQTYLVLREDRQMTTTIPANEQVEDEKGVHLEMTSRVRWWLRSSVLKNCATVLLFTLALFVLSMPEMDRGAPDAPGYRLLSSLVPAIYYDHGRADYFWIPLAAACLVAVIDRGSPFLRRLFTTRLAKYLGDISFAMYLVHGPLLWSYGAWLARVVFSVTGTESQASYALGSILCYALFWPVLLYEADLVTRMVDANSVAFSRWVYQKLSGT